MSASKILHFSKREKGRLYFIIFNEVFGVFLCKNFARHKWLSTTVFFIQQVWQSYFILIRKTSRLFNHIRLINICSCCCSVRYHCMLFVWDKRSLQNKMWFIKCVCVLQDRLQFTMMMSSWSHCLRCVTRVVSNPTFHWQQLHGFITCITKVKRLHNS